MTIPLNTIVLDLETVRSADDCRHCGLTEVDHDPLAGGLLCPRLSGGDGETFTPLGWDNKPALGLSIGCYWDYQDSRIHWFDVHSLEATVRLLVERQPLMVSFNGIGFDFVLMCGLLRQEADRLADSADLEDRIASKNLTMLCDTFKAQCATSYDLLAEIWKADPDRKFERGLNSLDAIAQANGLGAKLSHGAQAPRDWADGRYADVLNYCADDVYKTKALFELVATTGGVLRGDGQRIALPTPMGVTV